MKKKDLLGSRKCAIPKCGNVKDLKICSRCKTVYYCSRTCQSNDWSKHKRVCSVSKKTHVSTSCKEIVIKKNLSVGQNFNEGMSQFNSKKYLVAIEYFTQVLSTYGHKQQGNAHLYRGICHFKLKNFNTAIRDLLQSINVLKYKIVVNYIYWAMCLFELSRFQEGVNVLSTCVRKKKKFPSGQLGQGAFGNLFYQRSIGNYHLRLGTEALKDAQTARGYMKNRKNFFIPVGFVEFYFHLGKIYKGMGLQNQAIKVFDKLLKRNPNVAKAYLQRGHCYYEIDQVDLSQNDLNKAISMAPNGKETVNAYIYRGNLLKNNRDDFEGALRDYSKALEIKPENFEVHQARGNLYLQTDKLKKAKIEYQEYLKHDKDNSHVITNLALTFLFQRNIQKAKETMDMVPKGKLDKGMQGYRNLIEKLASSKMSWGDDDGDILDDSFREIKENMIFK